MSAANRLAIVTGLALLVAGLLAWTEGARTLGLILWLCVALVPAAIVFVSGGLNREE